MKCSRPFFMLVVLWVATAFLGACSSAPATAPPTSAPSAVALAPSATPLPPTSTPVPPTDTPIPPTDTPIPPTDTPTSTATWTPTATPLPSPTATATSSPTATRIPATATRRPTAAPSRTPTPAGPKYPAPVLSGPSNGSSFNCRRAPNPSWTWSGPGLGANEWFDVEFTMRGKNEWYGVAWTKDTQVILSIQRGMSEPKFLALLFSRGPGFTAGMGSVSLLGSEGAAAILARSIAAGPGGTSENGTGEFYPAGSCNAFWLHGGGSYEWKVRIVSGVQGSGKIDAILSPDSEIWGFTFAASY